MANIIGTDGGDTITPGDAPAGQPFTTDGGDVVYANGGNDTIDAAGGNDFVSGGEGDDTIYGGAGNDNLNGDGGSDTIYGGDGNDSINGDPHPGEIGDEYISGGNGNDSIYGGVGNDTLHGDDGDDIIYDTSGTSTVIDGGAGDDIVVVASGFASSSIQGGSGIDTIAGHGALNLSLLTYSGFETLATNVYWTSGYASQFDAFQTIWMDRTAPTAGVRLMLVETDSAISLDLRVKTAGRAVHLIGTADAETVRLDDVASTIEAGAGNDVLYGGLGNDSLYGGTGNDQLRGGGGNDVIDAGAGNDWLYGEDGNDILTDREGTTVYMNGGAGDDVLNVGTTFTSGTVAGSTGTDRLSANGGVNLSLLTLSGIEILDTNGYWLTAYASQFQAFQEIRLNAGNPNNGVNLYLTATGGPTSLDLRGKMPTRGVLLTGTNDAETVRLDDVASTVEAGGGNDILYGGAGNDQLYGRDGDDTLRGGLGADIIEGHAGNDRLYGEDGNDTLTDRDGTTTYMNGGAGDDVLVVGTTFTSGAVAGSTGTDRLVAAGGVNLTSLSLSGIEILEAGPYWITGYASQFAGFDRIRAGLGNETGPVILILAASGGPTMLDLRTSFAGHGGRVTGSADVETIIASDGATGLWGAGGDDWLTGGAGNDELYGEADNDTLIGMAGNNILGGGAGDDRLVGGAGNDTFYGDAGMDVVDYGDPLAGVTGGVTIDLTLGGAQATGGAGSDRLVNVENLIGTAYADTLKGNGVANILTGGLGDDVLDGGAGADMLVGGKGDDIYYVDNVGDVVVEDGNAGTDTVYASVTYSLLGRYVESLVLTGTGNIHGIGNSKPNEIIGNSGNNVIRGGDGSDLLTGGAGADWFAFDTAPGASNIDRITDFSVADDSIRLSRSVFGAIGPGAVLDADAFRIGTVATGAEDRILYNSATGGLFYDADGNGAGAAVQFARLSAGLAMTHADFLVVA